MPYYFAYGSNLSSRQMSERCPGSAVVGPAILDGYEVAFTRPSRRWGGHAADVRHAPGSAVHGLVWDVTDAHLDSLDRFEGVATGAYRRLNIVVEAEGHGSLAAVTYVVVGPESGGLPSPLYLATILEGARENRLPAAWIAYLETLAP